MKTGIALVVLLVAAGACFGASTPAETVPFDSGWWDPVEKMVDEGITLGYPGTHEYRRDQAMTRYEFAAAWARLTGKLRIEPIDDLALRDISTDIPEGHWANESVRFLAERGVLSVVPFSDVDPLHWAAAPVGALSPKVADEGSRYLLYRGDQPLLRREYMHVVHHTCAAARGEGVARVAGESVVPEKLVVDEGLFIGYPKSPYEMHPERPMTRWEFAVATARVLEWPELWDGRVQSSNR